MNIKEKIKTILHHPEFHKFVKFGVTGAMNTAIDYGLFFLLTEALGVTIYAAQPISYSTAALNSFIVNKLWTFGKRGYFKLSEFLKFILVNLVTLGFSLLALWIFHDHIGIDERICKVMLLPVTTLINFLGNRLFVFGDRKDKGQYSSE